MLPVAFSSQTGSKDPSSKAEVNTSEKTALLSVASSSQTGSNDPSPKAKVNSRERTALLSVVSSSQTGSKNPSSKAEVDTTEKTALLSVASSSQTGSNDPSPKAKVNPRERTACFRKPSSSKVRFNGNVYEVEILRPGALNQSSSNSEGSAHSGNNPSSITSGSIINSIEYKELSSSTDSPIEDPPPDVPNNKSSPVHKLQRINHPKSKLSLFLDTYLDCTHGILYSWNSLPFYGILIGLTSQAAYMGYQYSNECPFLTDGISLLFLMGCSGSAAASLQVISVLQKYRYPEGNIWRSNTQLISGVLSLFYIGSFCIELHRFLSVDGLPSTTIRDDKYCNPSLYGYVCWSNIAFSLLTLILSIAFVPPVFVNIFKQCCLRYFNS